MIWGFISTPRPAEGYGVALGEDNILWELGNSGFSALSNSKDSYCQCFRSSCFWAQEADHHRYGWQLPVEGYKGGPRFLIVRHATFLKPVLFAINLCNWETPPNNKIEVYFSFLWLSRYGYSWAGTVTLPSSNNGFQFWVSCHHLSALRHEERLGGMLFLTQLLLTSLWWPPSCKES